MDLKEEIIKLQFLGQNESYIALRKILNSGRKVYSIHKKTSMTFKDIKEYGNTYRIEMIRPTGTIFEMTIQKFISRIEKGTWIIRQKGEKLKLTIK